ncbi:MAG: hypothetical protein ABUL72_05880, partial [Armatimonadota bacterium]
LPASLTVPAGKNSFAVSFTPDGVSAKLANVIITGSTNGSDSGAASLNVLTASLISIGYVPSSIVGGNAAPCVVKLNGAAGPGGKSINLTSNSAFTVVPATIIVPAQSHAVSFSATTKGVDATLSTTTGASAIGVNLFAGLQLKQAYALNALPASPNVTGGQPVMVTIRLTGFAGPSGTKFTLTSNNAHAIVPASATVLQDHNAVAFMVQTTGVSLNTGATITCTGPGAVGTVQAVITVTK